MKKTKTFILLVLLTTGLCGCSYKNEKITIYSRTNNTYDNININLIPGYWVQDFSVDYENKVVTLNLYEEMEGK